MTSGTISSILLVLIFTTVPHHGLLFSVPPTHTAFHKQRRSLYMVKDLNSICDEFNAAIEKCQPEFIKNCKVKVGSSSIHRLGLFATSAMKQNDVALSIPYDDQIVLSPDLALNTIYKGILPNGYDGWTGDNGLIALLVLNELAKVGSSEGGIPFRRKPEAQALIDAWIKALPSPKEMKLEHPIMWTEEDQEILQSSSTKKVYRLLDDIEEDACWLDEKIWSQNKMKFPENVELNGETYPCFSEKGFAWAMSIATSRSVFVDGKLRLIPVLDMINHDAIGTNEVTGGNMGAFGTTKGAEIKAGSGRKYALGDEVFASYGPKSAGEYLLEHGFVPNDARITSVAEMTFECDPDDRFYDDKLDILEFETYESAPMEPVQSFDLVSALGRDGEPDPSMIQFLRLVKLGGKDAFLLESVFRKEVWGFMSLPVSEINEKEVLDEITSACNKALSDMESAPKFDLTDDSANTPAGLCAIVRQSESKALTRTLEFVGREKEALDLKEYYQTRRLKDLGLDSEWSPDDKPPVGDEDYLDYGQTRVPGSLDF